MNAKLIAKIIVARTDGLTRTGTGYPINNSLLLTARHVVDFKERDNTKPIKIEWSESDANLQIELGPEAIKFAFDGGDEYDVVILCCQMPTELKIPPVFTLLETGKISSREAWESAGYPKVNNFKQKGATGIFGANLDKSQIELTLDDTINEETLSVAKIENGWGGMSGAPVFNIKRQKIQAIITIHDQWMQKQLIGVSIPWLMTNVPEFRRAVGREQADQHYQRYVALQQQRIKQHLSNIEKSALFKTLAEKLTPADIAQSPERLSQDIVIQLNHDRLRFLEQFRQIVEMVLIIGRGDLENAKKLFQLVLGLYVESSELIEGTNVHKINARTRMSAEVTVAAKYGLSPDLVQENVGLNVKKNMVGRYAIDGECLREVGWKPQQNADEIIKVAYTAVNKAHKVVHGVEPKNNLDDLELEDFNETIRTKRQDVSPQLIRFEVASSDELKETHPLHDNDTCTALHKLLPELPVVRYGLGRVDNEGKLNAQVNAFFQMIQKYE
jgi:hypothetical protein